VQLGLTVSLGYIFRPRRIVRYNGTTGLGFTPAVSRQSLKAMRQSLRRCRFHARSDLSLADLSEELSPRLQGWINYYCRFRASEFQSMVSCIDSLLVRWAMRKYKRLRGRKIRAYAWLARLKRKHPFLFHHWNTKRGFRVGATGVQ